MAWRLFGQKNSVGHNYLDINTDGSIGVRTLFDSGLSIATGDVDGVDSLRKFGKAPDFDNGDGSVDIWDGANDAGIAVMQYVYSSTAAIDSLSSSDNSDTQDYEVQGLDENYALTVQTVTATGQTRAALTTPLIRVFRVKNVGSTDNAGSVYVYENTALSSGTPVDTSKIRASLQPGNNQTLMALYTIPAGYTGYLTSFYASTSGASKDSDYEIELRARPFGQVFQIKHADAISDVAESRMDMRYEVPQAFTEKTDIAMRAKVLGVGVTEAAVSAGFNITLVEN